MSDQSSGKYAQYIRPSPEQILAWVQANFEYKTRKGGHELCICNPFDGDTGYNFNIDTGDGLCHDWRGDGWVGKYKRTFLRFVQLYRKCTWTRAVKEVCGASTSTASLYYRLRQGDQAKEEAKEQSISLPPGSQKLLESDQPKMAGMLMKWLRSRGVDNDHIKIYDLHHQHDNVVWPYYEYDELVYWQSRNRLNKIYRFPDESVGVTKGMFLYGFDMVEPSDYAIVVEAIFGAHTLGEQTLASGGAVLTPMQVRKLRALNPVKGVILSPDNDKAGIGSLAANWELIKPYFSVYYSLPPKIEYMDSDGKKQRTKDWNELYTDAKVSLPEIRVLFEKLVKPLSALELVSLFRS